MKNKSLIAAALLIASVAGAQTTTTTQTGTTPPVSTTTITSVPTDFLIPDHLKGLTTETLRPEHSFPALGSYTAAGSSTGNVTITLDETNKGIVWIEGLGQGKFKALMKKAPSTYKIPSQQSASGKTVAEGTLFLNPETKELTILVGRPFDDADPTSFQTNNTKAKVKGWQYTGVKSEAVTTVAPPASDQ